MLERTDGAMVALLAILAMATVGCSDDEGRDPTPDGDGPADVGDAVADGSAPDGAAGDGDATADVPDGTLPDGSGDLGDDAADAVDPTDTADAVPDTPDAGEDGGGADGGGPPCEAPEPPALTTESIVAGDATFEAPVQVRQAPGDEASLYVVEQPGRIRIVRDGEILDEPFLDLTDTVDYGGERGLLGLAFHPDYADNGRFFVYYTLPDSLRNVIGEFERSDGDPDVANPEEVRRLIEIDDPEGNHNGGMITFGPDGYLYAGLGDGGGACDQHGAIGNGQNTDTLLGSLIRLDVDAAEADFAAPGNPFADGEEGDPRIWAYGLRNPWRFAFDADTGELYIGDVGQDAIEEIDVQPAESDGGENYGWRDFEGSEPSTISGCAPTGEVTPAEHVEPVVDIPQASQDVPVRGACSVTGGRVYRGEAIPGLRGAYLYGDFCSQDVAAFRYCDGEVKGHQRLPGLQAQGEGLAAVGEDHDGELYLVYVSSGEVRRIVPAE